MTESSVGRSRSGPAAIIRSVSSATFGIGGADAFERALQRCVAWMKARNSAVPEDAESGHPFDVGGAGTAVARAAWLDFEDGRIWSATIDDPDKLHMGRTWITELTVAEHRGEVHFGARLLNFTRGADQPFIPSVPRLVRDLIGDLPCFADGEILHDETKVVASPDGLDVMCALLERHSRRLPVVVVAEGVSRSPYASLETLTRRLAGAAHVFGITDECTWMLKRRLGRDLSVFDGAVRMYRPGLRFDEADPYEHPLWLAHPGRQAGDGGPVVARVLASGVAKGTTDYPRFDAVRQAATEVSIAAQRAGTTDVDVVRLLEEQNVTLREQLRDLRDEQNQWLADAETERASSEQQIAELRAELYRNRAQNEMLREAMSGGGAAQVQRTELTDLAEIQSWAAANLSTKVWISPKAIKETERHGQYRDPRELGEALYALDEIYVPMRRHPDDDLHRAWQDRMTSLGVTVTPCFIREGDLQRFPEYAVQYRGEKHWCDWHLKRGGGTDPRSMFRIYFTWDADEEILLIGHMPSHLDNNMTN